MDEKQLEMLRTQDWDEIAAKLLIAARVFGARKGWNRDVGLPGGRSLEDVVVETISDIWENPSRLSSACSLITQLKGIVRSKLWNLSQSADERVARAELEEVAESSDDHVDAVDTRDEFDRAIELLGAHPRVKSKSELELVLAAISCGVMDVDAITKETELSRERVYQLLRELRAIYPAIARQLQSGENA